LHQANKQYMALQRYNVQSTMRSCAPGVKEKA